MDKMVYSWARIHGGNTDALKRILKACDNESIWLNALMPSVHFESLEVIEESERAFTIVMISYKNPFDALMELPLDADVMVTMGWETGLGVRNRIQGVVRVELSEDEIASIDDGSDQYDVIIQNRLNEKLNEVWCASSDAPPPIFRMRCSNGWKRSKGWRT